MTLPTVTLSYLCIIVVTVVACFEEAAGMRTVESVQHTRFEMGRR